MVHLRQDARDQVITLVDKEFGRFLVAPRRDYEFVVFLGARRLHSTSYTRPCLDIAPIGAHPDARDVAKKHTQLQLPLLKREFRLAAKAFASGPDADTGLFFAEMAYEESPGVFALLEVQSVPYIFRLAMATKLSVKEKTVTIPWADKMTIETAPPPK